MWFKNLLIYRLTQNLAFDAETLEQALASKRARACESQELTTYGFVAPFGKGADAPLVHVGGDFLLVGARKEERILPGSVVRDAVAEKVEEIETEQMRKVYKKERDQIKDEIVQAFLPRAFIRRSSTFAAIAPKLGLILVNSPSPKRAEDLLSTLREVLGTLPVRPATVKISPSATMTDWLKTQKAAEDFFVLDECELRDTHEDGGIVRCKRQDLTSEELQMHLNTGKVVTQLAVAWQDKLSFVLDDKMVIKRLKFEDLLQDQAEQDGGDDALGQLAASFALMMLTLSDFLPLLLGALGGEELPQEAMDPATNVDVGVDTDFGAASDESDELYPAAVEFVRSQDRPSTSALQRHFKIAYNRAARILEELELRGVVSKMHTDGSRRLVAGEAVS
ncbi:recombination-associated protein RdgC [Pseudomonas sp. FW306-1C-G01A]|nr:recombination-associated protein RdgC [Pseudomonas sp. GW101-1A09]PMV88096.1 recombination-associated protein RdgC [Pseudomonas sp. FW306-2-2C-B10A]PMW00587.1 recombination-associated protein RdgC [Pseudomonas sp. MPR-TSA4]PMW12540.1 recombination-associated protein RdgC [Pseudomonas sp. FW306-2-1A-C05A]PMW29370.1 recombination-associated protein RdgC [Pseudomonas sp. FW305-3-2-15-A-R2A1]PMW31385.1 recombination-associated protein RdgC [Pseudomonas sp. MPR-E5]PMW47807.1 recombination-assoc